MTAVGDVGGGEVGEEGVESQPSPSEYFLDALAIVSSRWREALRLRVEAWWREIPYGLGDCGVMLEGQGLDERGEIEDGVDERELVNDLGEPGKEGSCILESEDRDGDRDGVCGGIEGDW